jgi:MFS family permease
MLADIRRIPKPIWVLSFTTFINRAGTMVLPFLVIYLTKQLHFSPGRAGFIMALYGIGALITAPAAGVLCDHYGPVKIMRISLFVSGLVLFLIPNIKGFGAMAAAVFSLALITEMFRPASLSAVTEFVEPSQRKPAFALSRLAINLGMSIGPAVGGFLAGVSYKWLFWIDGTTSLVAAILLVLSSLRDRKITGEKESRSRVGLGAVFSDHLFVYFLAAVIPVAFIFFQHLSAMPLYMVRTLGLSEKIYGLMFTVNTLLIVGLELPLNLATIHWSHRKTLVLGALLCGTGFGALGFATGLWTVMLTVVIWTFGEMILFPGMTAYVAHVAPNGRQGQYMGLYTMAFGISFAVAPWAGTQLLERWGGLVCWGSMFVLGLIAAVMMSRTVHKTEIQQPISTL